MVEFAGKAIDGYRRLLAVVGLLRPGEKAKVVFSRQGKRMEATVTLGAPGGVSGGETILGVELRPLDARDAAGARAVGGRGAGRHGRRSARPGQRRAARRATC